jgi:hypothetical protein
MYPHHLPRASARGSEKEIKTRALAQKIKIMGYVKIWIHAVWATKYREPLLEPELRKTIFTHIRENARKKEIFLDFING